MSQFEIQFRDKHDVARARVLFHVWKAGLTSGGLVIIETPRLRLRCWRRADQETFAEMNADPEVMLDLGGPISRAASDASSTDMRRPSASMDSAVGLSIAEAETSWATPG